jgi:hypothetical protein
VRDEPSTSLAAMQSCLGPELLRAALTDIAPSATRARVCRAIDSSLGEARQHAPDMMRSTVNASCKATAALVGPGTNLGHQVLAPLSVGIPRNAINPARVASPPVCPPSVRRRFGRFLPAIQLAAAVAVGVGSAAGARVLSPRDVVVPHAGAITSAPTRSKALTSTPAKRGKPGGVAAMNAKALRPPTPQSAPEPVPSGTEQPPDDWLGAQLSILSQASRSLRDGKPDEAMKSLETYAALFPAGLLDPQVTLLRQRAQLVEKRQVFIFP